MIQSKTNLIKYHSCLAIFLQKKVEKYKFLTYNIYLNHNAADLADLAPAKFLSGMVPLMVRNGAGGQGVLERGNGSVWVRERPHFGGGKSFT